MMTSLKKIRDSVDLRIDKLQARAEAFGSVLESTKEQIDERIASHKRVAQQALGQLATDIDGQKGLPAARKQAIHSVVDNLDRQIALAQSASRETLASARRQVLDGMRKMEAELEAALGDAQSLSLELLQESITAYARAVGKLDAELEAAEQRLASSRNQLDAAFKAERQAIAQAIAGLKQRLGERTAHTGEKLVQFEKELSDGLEHVVKALRNFFS